MNICTPVRVFARSLLLIDKPGEPLAVSDMLEIPYQQLPEDTLHSLIEEFITRDGTDYGVEEVSLHTKVAQIRAQLERGDILIAYDQETESCNIISKQC